MTSQPSLRILLVEDDEGYAFLVQEILAEQDASIPVDRASTLAEALAVLERGEHECVLLDLGLPDTQGVEGILAIGERFPRVPIVVLTGHDDDAVADATLEAGAQDYVVKGSEPSLRRAVRNTMARAAAEARLHESEERYRSIVQGLPGFGVMAFDLALGMTHLEGEAMVEEGYVLERPGQPAAEVFAPPAFAALEPLFRRALAGERFSVEWTSMRRGRAFVVRFSPVHDARGRVVGGVVLGEDVSERRRQEEALRHLADHDGLTGLVNRRCFGERLDEHIAQTTRYGERGALLVLDLDEFKAVNDNDGHHAGDRVLVAVADALRGRLRATDVIGRLGGDEFAVLLPHGVEAEAQEVARALDAAIRETGAAASVGVAVLDGSDASAEEALVRADLAMYEVKQARAG